MSFMAGLADGFAKSFGAMEDRRAALKQDAFRIAYDSYLKKQAKYAEDEKLDKQWVAEAKQIAADYGAPAEAWEHAYTMLKSGSSYDQAAERFGRTKFSRIATPAMGEELDSLIPGMADLTKQAGLTMENPAKDASLDLTQPNTTEQNPDILGSMTGTVGDIFNPDKIRERQMAQANKSVMSAAGVSEEDFNNINAGYQGAQLQGGYQVDGVTPKSSGANAFDGDPGKMPFAFLDDGTIVSGTQTPDGTGFQEFGTNRIIPSDKIDKIVSPAVYAEYVKAGGEVDSLTKDYVANRSDTISMINEIKGLSDMASTNDIVIAKSSIISTAFNEISNEIGAVFKQIGNMTSEEVAAEEKKYAGIVADKLRGAGEDAADAQAFAARAVAVKFKVARLLNGSGQLTNRDVQEAANLVLSSNDPTIFLRNAKIVASDLSNSLDVKAGELGKSFAVKNAKGLGAFDGSVLAPIRESVGDDLYNWMTAKDEPVANNLGETGKTVKDRIQANDAIAKKYGVPKGTMLTIYTDGTIAVEE